MQSQYKIAKYITSKDMYLTGNGKESVRNNLICQKTLVTIISLLMETF